MSRAVALGIVCLLAQSWGQSCSDGDVRLRGGTEFAGRVEVCDNETWGTICDRGWNYEDARVICTQLNLTSDNLMGSGMLLDILVHTRFRYYPFIVVIAAACGGACFGEGTGKVHYRDVGCTDENEELSQCEKSSVGGAGSCGNHSRDAGVICGNTMPIS